jgi:PTH1 family peptidyl-tRNA hydrolase
MSWLEKLFKKKESEVKYLIVGLGNKGEEYAETRHNIGFKVLDKVMEKLNISLEPSRFGMYAEHKYRGRVLCFLQPDTYMNLSGKAVKFWMQKLGIPIEHVLIITDDLNLPFGKIRVRFKGSNGGHNGLKSLEAELGSSVYPRMRMGIGNEFSKGKQVDYVLGEWTEEERSFLNILCDKAADLSLKFTHTNPQYLSTEANSYKLPED